MVLAQLDVTWAVVLAAAVLLAAFSGVMLLRTRRSIHELQRVARRLAQGDLGQRAPVRGPRPVAELAQTLNEVAVQLQDRLATLAQQRNEQGAVLSSMAEGVLALDSQENILSLNRSAACLLEIKAARAIGRPIQEVIRNPGLHELVARTLREQTAVQGQITLRPASAQTSYLQVQSALLRDARGRQLGAVLVLHDVTRLRRLERVRRDFVANVSHEVRTPVSAIKAAVETLLGEELSEPAQRFARIAGRQAERLHQIVEDLLSLARIEQQQEQGQGLELETGEVAPVLRAAVETCQANARERDIELHLACADDLQAKMNAPLLEQALVNLIDNAVKYSPPDTQVQVRGQSEGSEVVLSVADQGRGIEPQHLPRIFERFYRTDRARSRAVGGTGLGLSIVKHVAEAHGGRVSVDSLPGRGSVFRVHLQPVTEAGAERGGMLERSSR